MTFYNDTVDTTFEVNRNKILKFIEKSEVKEKITKAALRGETVVYFKTDGITKLMVEESYTKILHTEIRKIIGDEFELNHNHREVIITWEAE